MHLRDKPTPAAPPPRHQPKHLILKTNRPHILRPTGQHQSGRKLLNGLHNLDSSTQGPAQRQPKATQLELNPDHLLTLKPWPKGQASNLTHTSRSLLKHSLGMENGRHHLTLSLCCAPEHQYFPKERRLHVPGAPIFPAATQDMILDRLALKAGGACIPDHMQL